MKLPEITLSGINWGFTFRRSIFDHLPWDSILIHVFVEFILFHCDDRRRYIYITVLYYYIYNDIYTITNTKGVEN